MSFQTAPDIPILITVPGDSPSAAPLLSAERRVSPAWTISQFKTKMEPVTGIPAGSQSLRTKDLTGSWISLDEDSSIGDGRWGLRKGSEIEINDTRPPSARQNFTDVSAVPKYEMPESQYEQLSDSVLAWKRKQKLGRFDPNAKSQAELEEERSSKDEIDISTKGIEVGRRCRVGAEDARRGVVRFVGAVEGLGGEREAGCRWIGVEFDEPLGRNDGSVMVGKEKRKLFTCKDKFGVLARPEKVEVGDWPPLDDLEVDEDMEEI